MSTHSISLWKVAGAFVKPNGITLNPLGVENAVFSLESSSSSTCQYPEAKSNVVKNTEPVSEVQRGINSWQWEGITMSDGIYLPIVHTKPPGAILLPN